MCIRDRYASLGGYFAYGFRDKNWKFGGDLTVKPLFGRDFHVKFSYENDAVSYTHLRAHETVLDLVCRLLLEKKTQ